VAFVIVSAGHLADSQMRTLRARPLALVAGLGVLLLMAGCVLLGYRLAQLAAPDVSAAPLDLHQPQGRALVNRLAALTGRLVQLEHEAETLASRLGVAPVAAALAPRPQRESSGGPLLPVGGLDQLEEDFTRLEGTFAHLSEAATERELETMAFPNRMPVAGSIVPVSSHYGLRRDPFTGRLARHSGLDIPARYGTPILASGGGRVVAAGYKGAYGQSVMIDHGDGLTTLYGHASRLLVRTGDIVMPQQKIALVGSTGRSTGPHLHFEVIRNGRRVQPQQYLAQVLDEAHGAGGR
jgi:murein DD-endopeptidase MepM/ murein hydrolase activator NlpD